MPKPKPLKYGTFYHIFNRGNNKENIFYHRENYIYFLKKYQQYILPIADTYAYCLLRNHFHFLVRTKTVEEIEQTLRVLETLRVSSLSQQFSNFFNSYSKSFNKRYQRTGSLLEHPFKRKIVDSDCYFLNLVHYIHFNPQKHRFIEDFRQYPWSSYNAMISEKPTKLRREDVLHWFAKDTKDPKGFGNPLGLESAKAAFRKYHELVINYEKEIGHLIIE
jgi:REP element-mobilizing transposase RayT